MVRRLILPLMLVLTMATIAVASEGYANLQAVSVRVDVGGDYGTGVLVTREVAPKVTRTFVWTAGHVVERVRQLDGTFKHATIYQEHRYEGNRIGASRIEAKVIAYSSADTGEDLALLEILQDNFRPVAVSATFYLEDKIPGVGSEVVHVGCTRGLCNSVSLVSSRKPIAIC